MVHAEIPALQKADEAQKSCEDPRTGAPFLVAGNTWSLTIKSGSSPSAQSNNAGLDA